MANITAKTHSNVSYKARCDVSAHSEQPMEHCSNNEEIANIQPGASLLYPRPVCFQFVYSGCTAKRYALKSLRRVWPDFGILPNASRLKCCIL